MGIKITDYNLPNIPTWCSGCGNFAIHASLKKALSELEISPTEVFISFDIGCNGNGAGLIKSYGFKGLHGRSIPLAVGAHLANRRMTAIADIGDGGCFHEGLDHLVHAIRSNYNITILIHNNASFALTTGQATVSTPKGKPMYGQPAGIPERNINIPEFILNLDPSFYARAYSGNPLQMGEIFKSAIENKGCSIVEVLQLCPTYNREFTPEWAKANIKEIKEVEDYNANSIESARSVLTNNSPLYTGIIYQNKNLPTFYDSLESRKNSISELVDEVKTHDIKKLLKYFE